MQPKSVAFILRVWVEEREIEGAKPIWRGVIENAESGERRYLNDLGDIAGFVARHLEVMGVEPDTLSPQARILRSLRRRGSSKPADSDS